MSLIYPIGSSGELVEITDAVLDHLQSHRQMRWWQKEAGGLLFAYIDARRIVIVEATGPSANDTRSRFSFSSRLDRQQEIVDDRFEHGLHYVGDWHTHPEACPSPSSRDLRTMASRVKESTHGFRGFLFAIIGRDPLPGGLTMMFHDGEMGQSLRPETSPMLAGDLYDSSRV